jgi:hypothetical protein
MMVILVIAVSMMMMVVEDVFRIATSVELSGRSMVKKWKVDG